MLLERFEGVIADLRTSDRDENFQNFRPEFARRDLIKGLYSKTTMCQPVINKRSGTGGLLSDRDEL